MKHRILMGAGCLAMVLLTGCGKEPEARVQSADLSEYRTEYVGDAPSVVKIVSGQSWPEGLSYDHVKIRSVKKPFGLTVYLMKEPETEVSQADLQKNAQSVFSLVDNLEEIEFTDADSGRTLAFFSRDQLAGS